MRVLHATSFGEAIWRIQNALHALFSVGIPIDIHWVQSWGLVRAALAVTAVADVTGRRANSCTGTGTGGGDFSIPFRV